MITYRGVRFSGYNKPKRTPKHPRSSHAVLAKTGTKVRLIRFGQQGVRGAGKNPRTAQQRARRRAFKARHRKNIAKGRRSAAYWANKCLWAGKSGSKKSPPKSQKIVKGARG